MASTCQVCGKSTVIGRNIRHQASGSWERKATKTSRTFKANVRHATIMLGGQPTRVNICTRCLRTMSKTK